MIFDNQRISRRTFSVLSAGAASAIGLMGVAGKVAAQDASPVSSPEMVETGAFDTSGLPEIVITADQYTFSASVPGSMAEGWYIITLENISDAVASANLALLPEGASGGDLSSAMAQSFQGEGGELPEWWNSATFAGGNVGAAGESTSTLSYLVPGKWFMFTSNPSSQQAPSSFSVLTPEELEENYGISADSTATPMASPVADTQVAPEGVVATVTVQVDDDSLSPDGTPAGGQQILQVINSGDQVHDMIVLHTEETVDESSATSLGLSWAKGEETGATAVGGVGTLSPGATAFSAIDVQPGTYVAFSSLPDANDGLQVDNGLVAIFTAQ